jgi:lipoate-protein ligase A
MLFLMDWQLGAVVPSARAYSLAGMALVSGEPPLVQVDEAREVVVVVSRSRNPGREVFLDRCAADGIAVLLRPSGGGAVVLAPGVVTASVLAGAQTGGLSPEPYFAEFCDIISKSLTGLGVTGLSRRGVSDLCLKERKVAGSSLRLWRSRVLFQAALLVCPDLSLLERYLPHPSRPPAYRAGRRHGEFVTSLWQAGFVVTSASVVGALEKSLRRHLGALRPRTRSM